MVKGGSLAGLRDSLSLSIKYFMSSPRSVARSRRLRDEGSPMCLPICSIARLYYIECMQDPVIQAGDPVLRLTAKPVAKKEFGSKKISGVIDRMKKALARESFGVAIAAPQVGESLRLFVIAGRAFVTDEERKGFGDKQGETQPPDMVFINPTLTRLSKKTKEMSEGCLSVRGKYGTVLRHEKATVSAQDEDGKPFTYHGTGLIAHI